MTGLGKNRSKFGEFLDKHRIAQERIREETSLGRELITRACNTDHIPTGKNMKKLLDAARRLTGKDVRQDDFWPM